MWIERTIAPRLLRLASTRPVLVLTGARQTGKTALLRRLFPEHHYVTLDLPSEAAQAEHDPEAFLARHPPPLLWMRCSTPRGCSATSRWRWMPTANAAASSC
jgi:hypothetical protein